MIGFIPGFILKGLPVFLFECSGAFKIQGFSRIGSWSSFRDISGVLRGIPEILFLGFLPGFLPWVPQALFTGSLQDYISRFLPFFFFQNTLPLFLVGFLPDILFKIYPNPKSLTESLLVDFLKGFSTVSAGVFVRFLQKFSQSFLPES